MSGVYRLNRTNSVVGRLNKLFEAASEDNWWLAGGIDAANCIAAYQPIGAADYATSKVNLANPGTYDAYEGTAPDWDAVNGWKFNGVDDYLITGITPTSSWSVIIRLSNLINGEDTWVLGNYAASGWGIQPGYNTDAGDDKGTTYFNGTSTKIVADRTSGVWGLAGAQGYYNGVADGNVTDGSANPDDAIWIGDISGAYRRNIQTYAQAIAIYNIDISAYVAGLTTAMAAL